MPCFTGMGAVHLTEAEKVRERGLLLHVCSHALINVPVCVCLCLCVCLCVCVCVWRAW